MAWSACDLLWHPFVLVDGSLVSEDDRVSRCDKVWLLLEVDSEESSDSEGVGLELLLV